MTLFDWALATLAAANLLSACQRGLGREMLHTVLFAIVLGGGYLFMQNFPAPTTAAATSEVLVNLSYYVLVAYVMTWAIMRFGAPLIMGDEYLTLRSRFWAGALTLGKIGATLLGLNLWLAIHSPDAHPLRLQVLPLLLRESAVVQFSDAHVDALYQWLAVHDLVTYRKYTYRHNAEIDPSDVQSFDQMIKNAALVSGSQQ